MASKREISVDGEIAYVPLTRGYTAIIDSEDVRLVENFNWYARTSRHVVYAATSCWLGEGRQKILQLHRVILGVSPDQLVDHRNRDGLDNRKSNLRVSTNSQNMCNARMRSDNKSGFKGVYWTPRDSAWRAEIKINGKTIYLGIFNDPQKAHEAYCEAAQKYHGEYWRPE